MLLVSTCVTFFNAWEIARSKGRVQIVKPQNYTIQDIPPTYIGNVVGNWYLYQVTVFLYGSGTSKDSIIAVGDASTPYCGTIPGAALRREVWNTAKKNSVDTTYQFIRPDSAIDYLGNIVYRVGYTTWEGIDTCISKFTDAHPIPSVDDDQIPDTLYLRPSTGTFISKVADTIYTRVEIRSKVKTTSTIQGLPVDSIRESDVWKFKLRENFGFTQIGVDSSHFVVFIYGYPVTLDTFDVFMKTLQNPSYTFEKPVNDFKIVNSKIYFDKPYDGEVFIYKADGRLYRKLYVRSNELDLSTYKGLYIIRIGRNYIKFVN